MKRFDYYKPRTLKEVLKLKDKNSDILAGGTDLIVDLRNHKKNTNKVIDIKNIKDFYGIKKVRGGYQIGACETFNSIASSKILTPLKALKYASSVMGCHEIRNRATIGGNICNYAPCCESGIVLTVYEAKINVISKRGKRTIDIKNFFTGVKKTCLKPGEVVLSIFIPNIPNSKSYYRRLSRTKGMDLATWNGAALVINPNKPDKREFRFAFGTVTPTPFRDKSIEKKLNHKKLKQKDIDNAFLEISEKIYPRESSVRATPSKKKLAIKNFLQDVLGQFI